MPIPARTLTLLMAGAMLAGLTVGADAQGRRSGYGVVTAESRYGPATITAPVRNGPQGRLEVRLPGGTWIECGRSCSDTLRQQTIDFWAIRDRFNGSGTDGRGYLNWRY
jgi:hypothetical protein